MRVFGIFTLSAGIDERFVDLDIEESDSCLRFLVDDSIVGCSGKGSVLLC
jgi:hypothetical protein